MSYAITLIILDSKSLVKLNKSYKVDVIARFHLHKESKIIWYIDGKSRNDASKALQGENSENRYFWEDNFSYSLYSGLLDLFNFNVHLS